MARPPPGASRVSVFNRGGLGFQSIQGAVEFKTGGSNNGTTPPRGLGNTSIPKALPDSNIAASVDVAAIKVRMGRRLMLRARTEVPKPEVMRRLAVPLTMRLDRLHLTLQAAFGWTDSHLFEFFAGEVHWGIRNTDGDFGHQPIDARKARLCDIVRNTGAKTVHYLYDFGDSWDHVIKLEKWFDNTSTDGLPLLLDAIGRCPPEDIGGPPGYAGYLEAIGDPGHPEHEHMRTWGSDRFDPNLVDRTALEAAVNALSEKWMPRRCTTRSK